ncbi:MAG: NUDIX domain-containing protein [Candidatus Aenigmarchaeota archaeon]|nr:NUDIX domain-containing protein [Candidatus Aenigmarchaeota archaeon]
MGLVKIGRPVLVVSAFIRKEDKFLLTYDPKFEFWRVPGGKPNNEEKIENALKREMKEELDIEISVDKFLGFGQDVVTIWKKRIVTRLILYFECHVASGKIKKSEEVTDYKWLTLGEIKNHDNLEPAMVDFFKRFLNRVNI